MFSLMFFCKVRIEAQIDLIRPYFTITHVVNAFYSVNDYSDRKCQPDFLVIARPEHQID